jgi:hypothetical protein
MAFSPEDLAQLAAFVGGEVEKGISAIRSELHKPADRTATVGAPDVNPEAGPKYWIHLANGDVLQSFDSTSSHMPVTVDGEDQQVAVIGRYQVGG